MSRATLTDAEARALGERWIAAGGGWPPGMLARHVDARAYPLPARVGPEESGAPGWWPDLRDPATRGACLEVVRERWGESGIYIRGYGGCFAALVPGLYPESDDFCGEGDSEPEALVAALEAAPQ